MIFPKYNQDQQVDILPASGMSGTGKIVGIASMGAPVVGVIYIIEPDLPFEYPEIYPYSHFCVPELFLRPIFRSSNHEVEEHQ